MGGCRLWGFDGSAVWVGDAVAGVVGVGSTIAMPGSLWLPKIASGLAQMTRWAILRFGMIDLLKLLGGLLVGLFRSRAAREAEMAFLRQQLVVLQRSAPARSGCALQIA